MTALLDVIPAILLAVVGGWLVWPVVADGVRRRRARSRFAEAGNEAVAQSLFDTWSAHGDRPGLVTTRAN